MLEGIELLFRGLEVDVQDIERSNRLEEGSYESAKEVFTNKDLAGRLGLEYPPEEYFQDYEQSDIRVSVI
jgi:hypothetical protein